MNSVLFDLAIAGIYFVYFFVTGYLLCRLLDIKRHRFLLSYALSLSIIVGSVALVYLLDLGKWAFLDGRPVPITSDRDYHALRAKSSE